MNQVRTAELSLNAELESHRTRDPLIAVTSEAPSQAGHLSWPCDRCFTRCEETANLYSDIQEWRNALFLPGHAVASDHATPCTDFLVCDVVPQCKLRYQGPVYQTGSASLATVY